MISRRTDCSVYLALKDTNFDELEMVMNNFCSWKESIVCICMCVFAPIFRCHTCVKTCCLLLISRWKLRATKPRGKTFYFVTTTEMEIRTGLVFSRCFGLYVFF